MSQTPVAGGINCKCPVVPQPLPPNLSAKRRYAQYVRTFGTFLPYNRAKTANLVGGIEQARLPGNGIPQPLRNTCGEIIGSAPGSGNTTT